MLSRTASRMPVKKSSKAGIRYQAATKPKIARRTAAIRGGFRCHLLGVIVRTA
jgi:hypothetical protein